MYKNINEWIGYISIYTSIFIGEQGYKVSSKYVIAKNFIGYGYILMKMI